MRRIVRLTWVAVVVAAAYVLWVMAGRYYTAPLGPIPASKLPPVLESLGSGVKILQFYAAPAPLPEGDRASLCYSVVNAKSLRLDPPVEEIAPSFNRCIPVAPEEDVKFTLTAIGHDGRIASASFVLPVTPDPERLPKIVYFTQARKPVPPETRHRIGQGAPQTLCYETRNAREFKLDPPEVTLAGAFRGCFYVTPLRTTTYTLIAVDHKGRKAERSLTVRAE